MRTTIRCSFFLVLLALMGCIENVPSTTTDAGSDASTPPDLGDTPDMGQASDVSAPPTGCGDGFVQIRGTCVAAVEGLEALAGRCNGTSTPLPAAGRAAEAGVGFGLEDYDRPGRTNEVLINSGPMVLDQSNTRYVLTEDISVDEWAFEIAGDFVTLDLNGKTITYGQVDTSNPEHVHGVRVDNPVTNVAVINGRIIKGEGACDGREFGSCSAIHLGANIQDTAELAGLRITIKGQSVSGIEAGRAAIPLNVHHVLIEDNSEYTTSEDSHAAILHIGTTRGTFHDNKIVGARKVGIGMGKGEAYNNVIELDSRASDFHGAIRIEGAADDYAIYDNDIRAEGVNPRGIVLDSGVGQGQIYSNWVSAEATRGTDNPPATAFWVRLTDASGVQPTCNWFELIAGTNQGSLGTNSTWGTRSRGSAVALAAGIDFRNNFVRATDESGESHAFAVSTQEFRSAAGVTVADNVLVATNTHFFLRAQATDTTGHVQVSNNSIVRALDHQRYNFVRNLAVRSARAIFTNNKLMDGASYEAFDLDFCDGPVDLGFGDTQIDYWLTNDEERVNDAASIQDEGTCGARIRVP